ncbi:MAG: PorT family protein [Bacteroidales bacterium]|nr:PorT family protein [Bacteroidales bacterium]MBN2750206.1 PorT family protein [Bacteroidales bacterium]
MKKTLIILAALMTLSVVSNAQFIRFGVKGGVSSSNVKFDKTTLEGVSTADGAKNFLVEQGDSKLGLHFGVFGRIQVMGLFIQPEVLFTQTKGEVKLSEGTNAEYYLKQKFNKFDIPVMVGWKFGPARVGLGPVASFVVGESDGLKDKIEKLSTEAVKNDFKGATFGYQIGVGLDILKFATIDLKYEGNLSKLGNGLNIGGNNFKFDQRNPQFIASIGIFF